MRRPLAVIAVLLLGIGFLGYKAMDFTLDASADSLMLENDKDLHYARQIAARYEIDDFLIVAYAPKSGDLFSGRSLNAIGRLREELKQVAGVASVMTLLDAPLLENPPAPISELVGNIKTLEDPDADRELAKAEFAESPIYKNLLISEDLKMTALVLNMKPDIEYDALLAERKRYRDKQDQGLLTEKDARELKRVIAELRRLRDELRPRQHEDIARIRAIMERYRTDADLYLGGVRMIADDMIAFIKKDLKLFGTGVFILLTVALGFFFRDVRWVVLPLACCAAAVISMMGLLGIFGWEVTVISSNFIALQLIITLSLVIHLVVRYRELLARRPEEDADRLVLDTVFSKFKPSLYSVLTTIAGFSSMLFSGIKPVIDFGWMMSAGLAVSLMITFIVFPVGVKIMGKAPKATEQNRFHLVLTGFLARFTARFGNGILIAAGIAFILSVMGVSRLVVENSFIDYFKKNTEIYKGMQALDQRLGGTTPLDVVVQLESSSPEIPEIHPQASSAGDIFDEFDEFDDIAGDDKYWFTQEKMEKVVRIHDYLEGLPEIGKVLSLGTMMKVAWKFNEGRPLDNFQLALLYGELPEKFRGMVLDPYVSIPDNEVRFSVRIRDSEPTLKRDALLKKIHRDLVEKIDLPEDHVRLSGVMVLYNNMLQSLFKSQILTLGLVVAALLIMFLILFRNPVLALIALFPNLLASGGILGIMGWLNIPLDMMTITIASISIGMAVDNTIHYIHRFGEEIKTDGDYVRAMHHTHGSIGHAMYYASFAIIMGFSILSLSNFIPIIHFGLFTGLAMAMALIAALTLLPRLLMVFKPFR